MPWRLRLKGHPLDLDRLSDQFRADDLRVHRVGEHWFLETTELDEVRQDSVSVFERGTEILAKMNGAARLLDPAYEPVETDGTMYDPGGAPHVLVFGQTAFGRGHARNARGRDTPDDVVPPAQEAYDVAKTNQAAAAVLRLLGQGSQDWVNLYRILDYIGHDCGGKAKIVDLGLATKDDLDRFGASANRVEVSGDGARHGPLTGAPPTRTMTLPEGQRFVVSVVEHWIHSLDGGHPRPR
jgi:hypothetical protein